MSYISYQVYVVLLEDYESLKKGKIYKAFGGTTNPGVDIEPVGVDYGYKYWYNVYSDDDIIIVDESKARVIWDLDEYKKEQRINKINKLIK